MICCMDDIATTATGRTHDHPRTAGPFCPFARARRGEVKQDGYSAATNVAGLPRRSLTSAIATVISMNVTEA